MKRTLALSVLLLVALTGCAQNPEAKAHSACLDSVRSQIENGSKFDFSEVTTSDFSQALFDLGVNDELKDEGRLFTTVGEFTYRTDGATVKKSVLCTATIEGGKVTMKNEAAIT